MTLRVLEIFDSLQGEGHWAGTPMTFVRLAGCNAPDLGLSCTEWCDTPESWASNAGAEMEAAEIVAGVDLPRLCITGGEPLLQGEGVAGVAVEARAKGIEVHLETNGTVAPPTPPREAPPASSVTGSPLSATPARLFDWTTVSPKPPGYDVDGGWDGLVDELKFVVDEHLSAAVVERAAMQHPRAVVCIQPAWGGRTTNKAVDMVMEHPEWRLCLQTHKYLGIV